MGRLGHQDPYRHYIDENILTPDGKDGYCPLPETEKEFKRALFLAFEAGRNSDQFNNLSHEFKKFWES